MFILSCESSADLTLQRFNKRDVRVLPCAYTVDGVEYLDDMREGNGLALLYNQLASGKSSATSPISVERYAEFFRSLLQLGDVLHVTLSGALSQSAQNAALAAESLRAEFPQRKLYVVDSLSASVGYGLLIDTLADLRDGGANIDEIYKFALDNRQRVNHLFFSAADKKHKLCPIMSLDASGKITTNAKARSEIKAIEKTLAGVEKSIENNNEYDGKLWIAHSNYVCIATKLAAELKSRYAKADVRIFHIGPATASHCGAGTLAVFFFSDQTRVTSTRSD